MGGNVGNHTVFFAKVCEAKVVAFEPFDTVREILRSNLELNNVKSLVRVLPYAVGAAPAKVRMNVLDGANLGATTTEVTKEGNVQIFPLDHFEFDQRVSLIKADIEGGV